METDLGPLVARAVDYLKAGRLASKCLSLPINDVSICLDLQRSRRSPEVGVLLAVYNEEVSEIASILFRRPVKYAIALESLTRTAPNGNKVPFSLLDFSEGSKATFLHGLHSQLPAFAHKHRSLDAIARSIGAQIEAGAMSRFNLPEAFLKLALVSHLIGDDWRRSIDDGKRASSPVFRETLERLEAILSERR